MEGKPLVSNLSLSFRRATKVSEDAEEVKKEHRQTIHNLIQKYKEDVENGKAEGIRTAKELIEVMKMDLLLMGEASERTETNNTYDDVRMTRISSAIDENDPAVQQMMEDLMMSLNGINDAEDPSKPKVQEPVIKEEDDTEE